MTNGNSAADDLARVYEAFGIGTQARTIGTLLQNISNARRRSDCLWSIEREFFTKEVLADDPEEEGDIIEECPLSWGASPKDYVEQFRAALSVCADGSKDALGWAWERRYSNGGYTRKFCTSEFEARELAKDSESLSIPDLVYPFFARADGGKGDDQPTGKAYSDIEEMFRDINVDDGKGEAVRTWSDFYDDFVRAGMNDISARALAAKYTAPQAECAPLPKQEPLGEPFQKVLDENRWNLYAGDEYAPRADIAEIFDHQSAGFERCFEALGITDDRERGWSSLVMAINDAVAPRETQPEKNHIETMVHNAKIIQALHVARYALVTHSGCRVICEGVSRTMDFEPELNQVDEVMTMLGVDLTEPLPAPVEWDSKDGDDE